MDIPEHLQTESAVPVMLRAFAGNLAHLIDPASPQKLARANQHLPFIFWRWYFKTMTERTERPYDHFSYLHRKEKWPKASQFLVTGNYTLSDNAEKATLELSLDLITLEEQPFLIDYHRQLGNLPPQYIFDDFYDFLVSGIMMNQENLPDQGDEPENVFRRMLFASLGIWYIERPDIQRGFDPEAWMNFWHVILQRIVQAGNDGYQTDDLLDFFTKQMRQAVPGYALTATELEEIDLSRNFNREQRKHILEQMDFWIHFVRYFLIPSSLYWQVMAPVYTDQEAFERDVQEALTTDLTSPEPFYAPPTALTITSFGKRML